MANYIYKVKSEDGHLNQGRVAATNYAQALAQVKRMGTVVELTQEKVKFSIKIGRGPKLSLKDRIIMTEQLAVMLRAGISLPRALRDLQEESSSKQVREVLSGIVVDVEGGVPFSTALSKQPRSFSSVYYQMVKGGEQSGNMSEILTKLAYQQQKDYELRGKVRGALIYPAIVTVLLTGVIILVITFVLPKLSVMFRESGVELPLSTRLLLGLSDLFVNDWYWLIGGLVGLILGFRAVVRTPKGHFIWDTIKLKIPVLGKFQQKAAMARFSQSFAFLSQAGVPMLDIFQTLKGVVASMVYEKAIIQISKDVENGVPISTAVRRHKQFPIMVSQLLRVGEESGDLVGILNMLGDFYEKEVDSMAKNLSTLLEPLIMIAMGFGIAFVLISVLQPMYGIINTV